MADWWAQRTCARKKRYPSYSSAKDALAGARERAERRGDEALDFLHVYRCSVKAGDDDHYHLGHATGAERRRLAKRAEKQRRKALVKAAGGR